MLPQDRAAIASFADRFQMRQSFTPDRDVLLKHLHDPFSVRMGLETRLYDALVESAIAVGKEEGRRVILALTDGKNWTYNSGSLGDVHRPRETLAQALSRDVMVYAGAFWTVFDGKTGRPDPWITSLADRTGGGYVELRPGTDMNATFTSVMEELHRQYVLGFVPQTFDGKEHQLDVRVKRSGVKIRARKSYVAQKRVP
jgi:VWFA-related protein